MRPRQCLYALFAVFLMTTQVAAQQITGRVLTNTGQPLTAVQVFIAGSGIGALSQQNGRYLLLNVPAGTHTVTAERIGYRSATTQVTVAAGATVVQDFTLAEEALGLDEIIVTGTPGGTQRRAIGNSVLSVSAATIAETSVNTDVKGLLRGRAPGVSLGAGGGIGQGSDITIRGTGSFNRARANPIVFVDGVRVNTDPAGPSMAQGNPKANPLDDFNPADIESVEIIKGPAAATLYGTEASAGVIQIITKKGREGAPSFNASIVHGLNFNRSPMDKIGTMFACVTAQTLPCRGVTNGVANAAARVGDDSGIVPYSFYHNIDYALDAGTLNPYWSNQADGACGAEACWPQENMFQYGPSRDYNLDVRGGTDRIRYFLSGNTMRREGPTYFNWDEANRMRANVSVVFSDQFTLDVASGFVTGTTSFDAQAGQRGGTWDQAVWGLGYCSPRMQLTAAPGESTTDCRRNLGFQQFLPTDQAPIESTREYDRFTGSGTLNFKLGSWLSSRAIVGVDRSWDKNTWLHPMHVIPGAYPWMTNIIQERATGDLVLEKPYASNLSFDLSTTLTKQFGAFNTQTAFGGQFYSKVDELWRNRGNGFTTSLSSTINQLPVPAMSVVYEYEENKSLGFYAQEQIGWNDRIFLTAAMRFDDNSTFGASFDPLIYPKFSGTWVVSEEAFWPLPDLVNEFRVRGAWGKAGRQPNTLAGVNTYLAYAGPGGTSAIDPESTGNPDVGPEKSTELELGFDASLLEGRISTEFSWYTRRNEDNLLGISLPTSVGAGNAIQKNVGVIENWGWEASVDVSAYQGDNVQFDLGLTGAYKMNEIKDIGDYPGDTGGQGQGAIKIGWPYPNRTVQYTLKRAELDPAGDRVDLFNRRVQGYCDSGVLPQAAIDAGQTDKLTSQYGMTLGGPEVKCAQVAGTRALWGPSFSPYSWTISPRLTIHNSLQITALVDGQFGGLGEDQISLWHHRYNTAYGMLLRDDPMYFYGYALDQWGGMAYYDRDFWKLREVGVRYQMPTSWAGIIGADRAALTFSGTDLAILWASNTGTGVYPSQKDMNWPQANILDVDFGRSAEGDGGHRSNPPISTFNLRVDVSF